MVLEKGKEPEQPKSARSAVGSIFTRSPGMAQILQMIKPSWDIPLVPAG